MSTPRTTPEDFAVLNSSDAYASYFNQLTHVFNMLLKAVRTDLPDRSNENYEVSIIPQYLEKLLYTIQLLRIKYTHRGAHSRNLYIDLTKSGFPNHSEISALAQDLLSRDEALQQFPAGSILKRRMLDQMLAEGVEPEELLSTMSQRSYRERLDTEKLFLPFVPGRIQLHGHSDNLRHYIFSWGCYDVATNLPYIYIMVFDHDAKRPPLEDGGANYHEFLDHVQAEGSRVPDIGILAMSLDSMTDHIHPKMIKRLKIGPFYSPALVEQPGFADSDPIAGSMHQLLAKCGNSKSDFICFYGNETVVSKGQTKADRGPFGSFWGPIKKVREVFLIPESDLDCYRKRASVIHEDVLMPHVVAQNLTQEGVSQFPEFSGVRVVSYDEKGEIYG